jgi:hypothetical protein
MARASAGVVVLLLAFAAGAEAVCAPSVRLAGDDPAYRYVGAYIDALSYGKQATQRLSSEKAGESLVASATRTLTELELGAKDFDCAARLIAAQEEYTSDDSSEMDAEVLRLARRAAGVTKLAYLGLAEASRSSRDLMEEMLAGRVQTNEMPARMARISTQAHEYWRTIFFTVPAVTHVLVDPEPDRAGRLSRLRITGSQRRDLVKSIDDTFGQAARKASANQPPPDATAAMLRQFLTGGHTDRGGK